MIIEENKDFLCKEIKERDKKIKQSIDQNMTLICKLVKVDDKNKVLNQELNMLNQVVKSKLCNKLCRRRQKKSMRSRIALMSKNQSMRSISMSKRQRGQIRY